MNSIGSLPMFIFAFLFHASGAKYPLKKMFELKEDFSEKCILIGTLFKHQVCCRIYHLVVNGYDGAIVNV